MAEAMDLSGVEIPLGVDLSGLDKGLASVPSHVETAVAKVKPIKITADLSGVSSVASQAAATITEGAARAAVAKVNAVGLRTQMKIESPAITTSGSRSAGTLAETVHETMGEIGGRSTAGHLLELAMGGGMIGFGAEQANKALETLVKLKEGTISWREALRSLPLFGTGMEIGDKLVSLATGTRTAAQSMEIAAEAAKRLMESIDESAKAAERMGAEVKGFQDAAREAGRGAADYAAKRLMPADAYTQWRREEDDNEEKKAIDANLKLGRLPIEAPTLGEVNALKKGFLDTHPHANYGTPEEEAAAAIDEKPVLAAIGARKALGASQIAALESAANAAKDAIDDAAGRDAVVDVVDRARGWIETHVADPIIEANAAWVKTSQDQRSRIEAALGRGRMELAELRMTAGEKYYAEIQGMGGANPAELHQAKLYGQRMDEASHAVEQESDLQRRIQGWASQLEKLRSPGEVLAGKMREIDDALKEQEIGPDQAAKLKKSAAADYKDATGEYNKYKLPPFMKYGGSQMAELMADQQMFMAKQGDKPGGGGDPAADTQNLRDIADYLNPDKNNLSDLNVTMGGAR